MRGTSSSSRLALAFSQASPVTFSWQSRSIKKERRGMLRLGSVTGPEHLGRSFNLSLNVLICKMDIILPVARYYVEN